MGIYLNPGYENFKQIIAGKIYVDKTMMISKVNELIGYGEQYICMSRPRRFGKTIAGEMLAAYYTKGADSHILFDGLKIANDKSYAENLNRYNVIKLDMNSEYQMVADRSGLIKEITKSLREEFREEFPSLVLEEDYSLAKCILTAYKYLGERFVIIIDEYDVLVREQVEHKLFDEYLSFLNGLFKSATLRPAIALAYLTGILPIIRDKVQSKLNNFREYTFLNAAGFAEYLGFTSDEVRQLCNAHGISYEECERWYDGYKVNGCELYNPESVVMCVRERCFENYWGRTSTYEAIAERIRADFEGTREAVVRMLSGESVDVNVTRYMNTMDSFKTKDDLFTYLIHIGYLAYDRETETCRIPNREVSREWRNAIETETGYKETNRIIEASKQLLKDTLAGDEEAVSRALDISHIHVTSNRSYNNEDALQSAIYLAYIYALNEYTVVKEMTAGKGFADVCFIPFKENRPAMIIELKRNDSAESGLAQIREKQYYECLSNYQGDILLVGINYNEKDKTHSCRIERTKKETA